MRRRCPINLTRGRRLPWNRMAFIAPFHFLPLNTSCERASVRGTAARIAGLPSKHLAQCRKPGASAPPRSPRRAAAAGRASTGPGNRLLIPDHRVIGRRSCDVAWMRRSMRSGLTCRRRTPVQRSILALKLSPMRTTYCSGRTGPEPIWGPSSTAFLHPMRGAAGTEFGRKARTSVLLQSRRWPLDWPCTKWGPTRPNMVRCRTMRGVSKSPGPWHPMHKAVSFACAGARGTGLPFYLPAVRGLALD